MSAVLNGDNSVNRLIATLAGSAVLLSESAGATSILPASTGALQGETQADACAETAATTPANAGSAIDLVSLLAAGGASVTSDGVVGTVMATLGVGAGAGGGDLLGQLPLVGGNDGIPVVGDLLGGGMTGGDLPIVGSLLGGDGLPVVGDLLGAGATPILGNLLGSDGLPTVGNLLGNNGLPNVGNLLGGDSLPIVGNILQSVNDTLTATPLTLAGPDGTLQPVFSPANAVIKQVHQVLEALSYQVGLPDAVHAVTSLGETIGLGEIGNGSNLVTDVVNLPGDLLSGNLHPALDSVSADLTNIVNGAGTVLQTALFNADDPTNPVPELIQSVGSVLQTQPLLSLSGGNSESGGLLGGVVGDIAGSSSGHLINLNLGPDQGGGLPINLLAANDAGPSHTVDINAVDVGPNGPTLVDLGVLTGGGLLGGASLGSDDLVGNLLGGVGGIGGATAAVTPATPAPTDLLDSLPVLSALDHGPLNLNGLHIL